MADIQRVTPRTRPYVNNEVLIRTIPQATNGDLPHFLSVSASRSQPQSIYGDPSIDNVLQRATARPSSISRVFVPSDDVKAATLRAGGTAQSVELVSDQYDVSSNYNDGETGAGLSRIYRISFEDEVNVQQMSDELEASNAVEAAHPNWISEANHRPSDEFYGFQWGPPAIGCEAAWGIETGHSDVRIAIVDSGVDLEHEDLAPKLAAGFDFVDVPRYLGRYVAIGDYRFRDRRPNDEDGHGSHCAGIAASDSNNGRGIAGVCWGGKIIPVRVMVRVIDRFTGRETSIGTSADIDAGIKFAVDQGAHAINLSLSGPSPSHESVLEYAYQQNVCVLAATGNESTSDASFPASNPRTLAVGAVDPSLNRATFSNYGPNYGDFVVAPGVQIASTYKDNGYVYLQGTSMATPFVTGMVGLMVSRALRAGQHLSVDRIYKIIRDTATVIGNPYFLGRGLVDVRTAIEEVDKTLGL